MSDARPVRALFVTGASGFVGRRLLARLSGGEGRLTALSRTPRPPAAGITWVQGDIRDAAAYLRHLDPDTDVVHLAAATGGAAASVHHAVNAEGTAALVGACAQARVGSLLLVSSIAARFPDDPHYPYATAKREAERVVRAAAVPCTIVRPTIVLGPGSPIAARLRSLACGPVIAVIGGGHARVQPVDVDDLASALAEILARRGFRGATLEFGGPEVLSMAALLARLRAALGRPPARVLAIPYAPLRAGLIALGAVLGSRSPVTPGQLSSFVHDGVAEPNPLWEEMRPHLASVERMLRVADDDA